LSKSIKKEDTVDSIDRSNQIINIDDVLLPHLATTLAKYSDNPHIISTIHSTDFIYAATDWLSGNLFASGQIVAIIPRSFCNSPYYRPFRNFIPERTAIHHIHLFQSRSKAVKDDNVLKEYAPNTRETICHQTMHQFFKYHREDDGELRKNLRSSKEKKEPGDYLNTWRKSPTDFITPKDD
jgi:hypothetical protein